MLDVVAVKPADGGGEEPIRDDLSDPRVLGEDARMVCVVGIEGEVGTAKPPSFPLAGPSSLGSSTFETTGAA